MGSPAGTTGDASAVRFEFDDQVGPLAGGDASGAPVELHEAGVGHLRAVELEQRGVHALAFVVRHRRRGLVQFAARDDPGRLAERNLPALAPEVLPEVPAARVGEQFDQRLGPVAVGVVGVGREPLPVVVEGRLGVGARAGRCDLMGHCEQQVVVFI